jgi:tRNA threonylcarbamoyladenosine biosynthesis protein TsaB
VRVGASVANALGFSLKIPVNGKKVGDLVEPLYNK